jgi:hypothetical protein
LALFIAAGLTAGEVARGAAGRVVGGVTFLDLLAMIDSPNGSRQAWGRLLLTPSNSNTVWAGR